MGKLDRHFLLLVIFLNLFTFTHRRVHYFYQIPPVSPGHPFSHHQVNGVQCLDFSQLHRLLLLVFHPMWLKQVFNRHVHRALWASRELLTMTASSTNLLPTPRQQAARGTHICSIRQDIMAWPMALLRALLLVLVHRPYQRDSESPLEEVKCFHINNPVNSRSSFGFKVFINVSQHRLSSE